jgi:hypothetical protein
MRRDPCDACEFGRFGPPLVRGGQGRDAAGLVSDALIVVGIIAALVALIVACWR